VMAAAMTRKGDGGRGEGAGEQDEGVVVKAGGRRQAPGRESEPPTRVLCCRGPSEGIGNARRRSQSRSR
jgi:hypothetical protein